MWSAHTDRLASSIAPDLSQNGDLGEPRLIGVSSVALRFAQVLVSGYEHDLALNIWPRRGDARSFAQPVRLTFERKARSGNRVTHELLKPIDCERSAECRVEDRNGSVAIDWLWRRTTSIVARREVMLAA